MDYQLKIKEKQEKRHVEEVLGCTFAPKILNVAIREVNKSENIHEHLYKSGVTHWQKRKSPKSSEQIEYENSAGLCTFHPNISRLSSSKGKKDMIGCTQPAA